MKTLSAPARRAIFEALVAMAWADTRLERAEILAVQAAGRVLALPDDVLDALDAGPPPVEQILAAPISDAEKRIAYTCAAWMAAVDDHEGAREHGLLARLADGWSFDDEETVALREDARMLRVTTSPDTPWWKEIELLVERVLAEAS